MLCIYHGNCIDGFSSALIVYREIDDVDFYPAIYGVGEVPYGRIDGQDVLMVDFSYPREVMVEIAQRASTLTILDHHDTAESNLAGLNEELGMGEEKLKVVFDQSRSGAGLAWDYLCDDPRPMWVDLVEDRDLWKFRYGDDTRNLHFALTSYPQQFDLWDELLNERFDRLLTDGAAARRYHDQIVEDICAQSFKMDFPTVGHQGIPVACAPYHFASDVGHRLGVDAPFAAIYFESSDSYVFSLRSRPDGVRVNDVAAEFGGGGHPHAAGFRLGKSQRWW